MDRGDGETQEHKEKEWEGKAKQELKGPKRKTRGSKGKWVKVGHD